MDHLAERGQGEVAILATGRRLVGPDGDLWNTFGGRAFHAAFEESRFRMIVLDRHLVVRGANRAFREAEGAGVSVVGRSFTGFFVSLRQLPHARGRCRWRRCASSVKMSQN